MRSDTTHGVLIRLRGSFSIATIVAFRIGVRTGRYRSRIARERVQLSYIGLHPRGIANRARLHFGFGTIGINPSLSIGFYSASSFQRRQPIALSNWTGRELPTCSRVNFHRRVIVPWRSTRVLKCPSREMRPANIFIFMYEWLSPEINGSSAEALVLPRTRRRISSPLLMRSGNYRTRSDKIMHDLISFRFIGRRHLLSHRCARSWEGFAVFSRSIFTCVLASTLLVSIHTRTWIVRDVASGVKSWRTFNDDILMRTIFAPPSWKYNSMTPRKNSQRVCEKFAREIALSISDKTRTGRVSSSNRVIARQPWRLDFRMLLANVSRRT